LIDGKLHHRIITHPGAAHQGAPSPELSADSYFVRMAAPNSISSRAASNRRQLAGPDDYVASHGAANKFFHPHRQANTNLMQNSSRRLVFG